MAKTLKEQFIAGLIAKGETKVKDSARYTIFTRAAGGFYYIGQSGALRAGLTRARSLPVTTGFKSTLILMGEGR